jgi:voltage-gated potassium channel
MKSITSQLTFFLQEPTFRTNLKALLKLLLFVIGVMFAFAGGFQVVMRLFEGQEHSFVAGLYWTVVTMSTLGFGDIVFMTDLGRLYSVFVLLSGVVLLLIIMPFAFIRFFYAPWLEAQIHLRAPRRVPPGMSGHILLCNYDSIAQELVRRLKDDGIPHFVMASDPTEAAQLINLGVSTVLGEYDSTSTYVDLRAREARLIVANYDDAVNTNIVLTIREVAPEVPVVAIASSEDAIDVIALAGATEVLPLKRWLGEHLANRVSATRAHSHVVGRFEDLFIAELPVRKTPLSGKTILQARLREIAGVNVIAVWERGVLHAARPDLRLTDDSVPVISGTAEQLEMLDELLLIYDINTNPVILIGGGRVGRAAAKSLLEKAIPVNMVEMDEARANRLRDQGYTVFAGSGADFELIQEAGIKLAPSVVISTHDDATNIFLTSYCRRLNPDIRIVTRITYERNVESVHRAGADFVLTYASLGATALYAVLQNNPLLILGEGLSFFTVDVPESLAGKSLAESGIGARTGMIVIGLRHDSRFETGLNAASVLPRDAELVMLGDSDQRHRFSELYQ